MHKLVLALLLLTTPAFAEPTITSNAQNESPANGGPFHSTALLPDQNHTDLWLASEGQGVWKFHNNQWQQFSRPIPPASPATGPGDNFTYALAQDKKHRLWVGTLNHGVSVFNGASWQTYTTWGPSAGPLGAHVFALAANPQTGDVWIATNEGLTRYNDSTDSWSNFSRADGLPSDQARALAISPTTGDLFVATAADGLLIGHPADNFHHWDHLPGPDPSDEPITPSGKGLPSPEGTALAIDSTGRIFLGTTTGLAISSDNGKSFSFFRGKDWIEKVQRRYAGPPENFQPSDDGLLSEDWITALSLNAQQKLWISHRTTGVERFDPDTNTITASQTDSPMLDTGKPCVNYVRGIATTPNGLPLIARYLVPPTILNIAETKPVPQAIPTPPAALPKPAAPPTLEELQNLQKQIAALPAPDKSTPAGAYLGEDWTTAGDWIGHIGRQFARLGAGPSFAADGYNASVVTGGHYDMEVNSTTFPTDPDLPRRGLFNPYNNSRVQSELNDQGFSDNVASPAVQGPDLWVKVNIPAPRARISIYLLNPDGQTSRNSLRDFILDLRYDTRLPLGRAARDTDEASTLSQQARLDLEKLPVIAHARASDMFPGFYEQFLARKPGLYWIKINRNHSFVTKLFGIFVDRLGPDITKFPHADYKFDADPPAVDLAKIQLPTDRAKAAQTLWQTAATSWSKPGAEALIHRAQLLAYRAADADHANPALLSLWRWNLALWSTPDRALFDQQTSSN
ncbi:MAG TPA: two-component regulator propeller domain-containing protein [Phycisphaerae bacterium]|nr:two-component regulator propeller domain-containing protein [Phycisphaerae bacterium]